MRLRNQGKDWVSESDVHAAWHRGFSVGVVVGLAVGVFVMLLALATV